MRNLSKLIQDYINIIILFAFLFNLYLFYNLIQNYNIMKFKLDDLIKKLASKCGYNENIDSLESLLRQFEEDLNSRNFINKIKNLGYFEAKQEGVEELKLERLVLKKNIFATIIEIFTMLGILGTVCSMAVALTKTNGAQQTIDNMIVSFNQGVTSTVYGLMAAIFFMLLYSYLNTYLENILEIRKNYLSLFEKAIRILKDNNEKTI